LSAAAGDVRVDVGGEDAAGASDLDAGDGAVGEEVAGGAFGEGEALRERPGREEWSAVEALDEALGDAGGELVGECVEVGLGGHGVTLLPAGRSGEALAVKRVRIAAVLCERSAGVAGFVWVAYGRRREGVRLAVRRCATAWTGKKPIVEVMVVRVAPA